MVVLPRTVVAKAEPQPILGSLIPTDVGYFPSAAGHAFERREGIDQAVLIYCVSGAGWCRTEGGEIPIAPGELLIVPPGLQHKYGASERQPWSIHWVHAKGQLLRPFLEQLGDPERVSSAFVGNDAQSIALFDEVLELCEQGHSFSELLQAGQALSHLMALLARHARQRPKESADTDSRIAQSIAFLELHFERELGVPKLARIAGLSPSRYSAVFKARTGQSPMSYLTRLRMQRACQLLETTEQSVKSISATVGYSDQLYFSRVFRAAHHVSPSDYRKQFRG